VDYCGHDGEGEQQQQVVGVDFFLAKSL
jgi:hypothetical protein